MKTIQILRERPETDYTHVHVNAVLYCSIQDCHKTPLSLIRYLYQLCTVHLFVFNLMIYISR